MSSIVIQGDTSGSITVEAPSVAGTHTLTLPKATGNIATDATVGLGTKNLIINGNMQIAQRGTSVTGITGSGYYTVDRWILPNNNIGTWTQSQDTDAPTGQGFGNSLKMQCTSSASLSAATTLELHQLFEGQNLQHLKKGTANAESLTLSFWVKTNKTGTYAISLIDNDNTRHIGANYTVSSADTWEKIIITFVGDTTGVLDNDNNVSLRAVWHLANGSDTTSGTADTTWAALVTANRAVGQTVNLADSTSNYINITGVQLEVGDTATPFEYRMYSQELAMCQRYFQSFGGSNVAETVGQGTSFSTTNTYVLIHLLQTMRSVPSLGYSAVSDWRLHYAGVTGQEATVMAISTNDSNNTKVIVNTTTATVASMGGGKCIQLTADSTISARLTFSAEL